MENDMGTNAEVIAMRTYKTINDVVDDKANVLYLIKHGKNYGDDRLMNPADRIINYNALAKYHKRIPDKYRGNGGYRR